MPQFKVTDPGSGKTLLLEGDSPPTETELVDIFGQSKQRDTLTVTQPPPTELRPESARQIPQMRTTQGGPRVPVASLSETLVEPKAQLAETLTHPSPIPTPFKIQPNENPWISVGKEAVNIAVGVPQFFTSALGTTTVAAAPVAPTLVAAAFTVDMLRNLGEEVVSMYKNWNAMTPGQKAVAVEDAIATGAFATLTGAGTVKGLQKRFATAKIAAAAPATAAAVSQTIEVANASRIREGPRPPESAGIQQQGREADSRRPVEQAAPEQPQPLEPGKEAQVTPLQQVAKVFLDEGKASVSLAQRRLKMRYSQAVDLVNQLEKSGAISPQVGGVARTIDREKLSAVTGTEVTPAIQTPSGRVVTGEDHVTAYETAKATGTPDTSGSKEGFVDKASGAFISREEAAAKTGLPTETEPGKLHSSDLPEAKPPPVVEEAAPVVEPAPAAPVVSKAQAGAEAPASAEPAMPQVGTEPAKAQVGEAKTEAKAVVWPKEVRLKGSKQFYPARTDEKGLLVVNRKGKEIVFSAKSIAEIRDAKPPVPTVQSTQALSTAGKVTLGMPKAARFVQVTLRAKGKDIVQAPYTKEYVEKNNPFAGSEVVKIEAGNIGKDKKFVPVKGDVTVTPAKGISEGPGAASPGDVPPPPPAAEPYNAAGGESKPHGETAPASFSLSQFFQNIGTELKALAGQSMPKTTASNRLAGEAGARYASSRIAARPLAEIFSAQTLEGTEVDPVKFGAALVEDNLRSVRESFRQQATELRAEGKEDEAAAAEAAADSVRTIVGEEHSPFKTEDDYQDYLNDPQFKQAAQQHIQQWNEIIEPQFKEAQSIDPDVELPTRGQQTGARVNLKVVFDKGEARAPVGGGAGGSLTATFKRRSPFGIAAKGTGEIYETYYPELIANTFERQLEIANKNAFDKSLVEAGDAEIHKPGWTGAIKGEPTQAFPLKRGTRAVTTKSGETFTLGQAANIYVRRSLAQEYRTAANVDPRFKIPYVTRVMDFLNRTALAGLTDFTVHTSNLMTALFNRPASGKLFNDTLLSATGRADVPVTIARAIIKASQNNKAQIAELAKIGALRGEFRGKGVLGWSGRILKSIDQTTRLVLDDTFKSLAKDRLVEDTETNRREYVNQIGQYNRRLQGPIIRFLRDSGFGPFATAGRTFNALGVKMITLSPGARSSGAYAAAALRANALSKWIGAAVLVGTLNYILTRNKGGGVMGRPGTPIGKIDTGLNDKNGKPLQFPLFDVIGLGRGLRVTGARGAIEAKRLGLSNGNAIDAAGRDIVNSWVAPAAGPPVRFGFVAASGSQPAVGVGRAAPVAPPGQSQVRVNVQEALKEANPVVNSYLDWRSGKSIPEALARQLPRFTLTPGKPPEMIEKYPKIVGLAQTYAYADWLVGAARKLAPESRRKLVKDSLTPLTPQQRQMVLDILKRRGIRY